MPHQAPRVPGCSPARPVAGPDGFPRTERWDPETVLGLVAESAGVVLLNAGRCRGGEVGACYVRWPDGHLGVLTAGPQRAAAARQAGLLTAVARAAGVPAPRYELIAEGPGLTAVVQELLPGSPPDDVTASTLESMLEVNRKLRGVLAGRDEVAAPSLYLLTDGPGFCLHGPMAAYDRRTARLLAAIEEIGAAVPEHLHGDDLVHFDFHPENVLIAGHGEVTGVVDWDGAGRGDATLDLMTLWFDLTRRAPQLAPLVERELRVAPQQVLLASWAHMSLRLVDWSIREHGRDAVESWLGVATRLIP